MTEEIKVPKIVVMANRNPLGPFCSGDFKITFLIGQDGESEIWFTSDSPPTKKMKCPTSVLRELVLGLDLHLKDVK